MRLPPSPPSARPEGKMQLSLIVVTPGRWQGKSIPVSLSRFLIGRGEECHLRPTSSTISKRHCALLIQDGRIFVRDFDSTNGTFLNDRQIKGEVELWDGDHLRLGRLEFAVRTV